MTRRDTPTRGGNTTMSIVDGLSPSQQKLYDRMSDWRPHTFESLRDCLWDDLSGDPALFTLIHRTRMRLRRFGLEIVVLRSGDALHYQLVRLINRGE